MHDSKQFMFLSANNLATTFATSRPIWYRKFRTSRSIILFISSRAAQHSSKSMSLACALAGGPAAFKDVFVDSRHDPPLPLPKKDHSGGDGDGDALTSNPMTGQRLYQGTWVIEGWIPGIVQIQNGGGFTPRRGDVILASPPKCGTTWLKALAFATMARGAHPPAAPDHPLLRHTPHDCVPFMEVIVSGGWGSKLDALPSPRLLSTHMPYSTLPASITKNPDCKIVYICRDPKDMVVSMWHFLRHPRPNLSFNDMFELTCEGRSLCGPFWDHILGYWNAGKTMSGDEGQPEMTSAAVLFLRYEEMIKDPANNVRKLARFVGQPFSAAEEETKVVDDIVDLCSFEKLSSLKVNKAGPVVFTKYPRESFFRRGGVGDWMNHMTPEMAHRFDALLQSKFHGSGLDLL
uniref:Sulfotransferase n=2 Tax=Aegilops tauschii subsp. strangulata TaxID=200361 RepID=A0A453GJU5_AEGTS